MNSTKRGRAIRLALAASGALGVLAIFVGVAGAAGNSTATLAAGTLAIANPTGITFSGTLNGATQYWSDTTDTLQVVNPGRNGGWNVTAVFDDFSCSTAATCDSTTLTDLSVNGDTGSSTASTAPTPTCTASSVCILPTLSSLTFPQPISDNATPTKIFNADTDTGVGKVTAPIVWWLTTPADTLAGTYTSTLTLGINSGP